MTTSDHGAEGPSRRPEVLRPRSAAYPFRGPESSADPRSPTEAGLPILWRTLQRRRYIWNAGRW
jgi:hypothetical protein